MSTPPQDTPTNALYIVPAGPERAAALRSLSAALAQLGDDAARAAQTSPDVRLHVVACQAQHLAGDVWDLLPADCTTDDSPHESGGLAWSVIMARRALEAPDAHPLPAGLVASLGWLLQLAEAVTS
jgi:hypothetical protein